MDLRTGVVAVLALISFFLVLAIVETLSAPTGQPVDWMLAALQGVGALIAGLIVWFIERKRG